MTAPARADADRSAQRRREVCEAARRVICRKGLEVTTMRDISREGGFTTGVLTHWFPDKQAVIHGAFAAASDEWLADVRARLARAQSAEDQLVALVQVALPDDETRRAEWRLWSEMWTYAGRDTQFAARLVSTDAMWEREIREVLEWARSAGVIGDVDIGVEAPVLARLIDGLGLRAWLSGQWDEARDQLVAHLATLGMEQRLQKRLRAPGNDTEGDR
jgi:TetR/AcrR family transcriptional regulator, transcriptional repressor of bet genes